MSCTLLFLLYRLRMSNKAIITRYGGVRMHTGALIIEQKGSAHVSL